MVHEVTFDSQQSPNGRLIDLASGYVSLNKIVFVKEQVAVTIEAKTGRIELLDKDGNVVLTTQATTPLSGDEKFSEVQVAVEGAQIKLGFPRYTYIDHYPNCDGEHDRWSKSIAGYDWLCLDYQNGCVAQ